MNLLNELLGDPDPDALQPLSDCLDGYDFTESGIEGPDTSDCPTYGAGDASWHNVLTHPLHPSVNGPRPGDLGDEITSLIDDLSATATTSIEDELKETLNSISNSMEEAQALSFADKLIADADEQFSFTGDDALQIDFGHGPQAAHTPGNAATIPVQDTRLPVGKRSAPVYTSSPSSLPLPTPASVASSASPSMTSSLGAQSNLSASVDGSMTASMCTSAGSYPASSYGGREPSAGVGAGVGARGTGSVKPPKDKTVQRKLRNKESARRYREKQVAKRRQLENYTRSLADQNQQLEALHEKLLSLSCGQNPPSIPPGRSGPIGNTPPLQDINK